MLKARHRPQPSEETPAKTIQAVPDSVYVDKKGKTKLLPLPLQLLVLTSHTDDLCFGFALLASLDYHGGQLTAVDTA